MGYTFTFEVEQTAKKDVQTVLQESSISRVTFTVETEPLCNKSGSLVGIMDKDSFVENPGEQINTTIEKERFP